MQETTTPKRFTRRPSAQRGSQQRSDTAELVAQVAPSPAPCFANKVVWVETLQAIQADSKLEASRKPLTPDGKFNYMGVNFCAACPPEHKARMRQRCRPDWFKDEEDT
jgi:hypothetical protein